MKRGRGRDFAFALVPEAMTCDYAYRLRRRMDRAFELGMRGLCLGRDRDIGAVASGAQRDREPDAA